MPPLTPQDFCQETTKDAGLWEKKVLENSPRQDESQTISQFL